MAMTDCTVRATTNFKVSGTYPSPGDTSATSPLKDRVIAQAYAAGVTLEYGTSSGQCDLIVCRDKTLTAASSATYDLYTGTDLTDIDAAAAPFRKIKYAAVFIVDGGDTAGVRVGGAASNPWGAFFADVADMHDIFPDGPPYQGGSPAGKAVSSPGSLNFKVANLGAVSVTVRIVLAGTSS